MEGAIGAVGPASGPGVAPLDALAPAGGLPPDIILLVAGSACDTGGTAGAIGPAAAAVGEAANVAAAEVAAGAAALLDTGALILSCRCFRTGARAGPDPEHLTSSYV